MYSSTADNSPAFWGLRPSTPEYIPLDSEEGKSFSEITGFQPDLAEIMISARKFPYGFFRVKENNYAKTYKYFVKIVSHERFAMEKFSLAIMAYLHSKGVPCFVSNLIQGQNRKGKYCVTISPYLEFNYFSGMRSEARAMGKLLRVVHQALTDYPKAEQIKNNWQKRYKVFTNLRDILHQETPSWWQWGPEKKGMLITGFPLLNFGQDIAQVVHGDINFGNLLFPYSANNPILIDFENSKYSYFPVYFDIAMLLERFFLVGRDKNEAEQLFNAFQEGYGEIQFDKLFMSMKAMTIRSLFLLTERTFKNIITPASEWKKFFILLEQSEDKCSFLIK